MLKTDEGALRIAERLAARGTAGVMDALRASPLNDFARLLLGMPNPRWPGLSQRLPAMVPPDVQISWTGAAGEAVMGPAVSFIRVADAATARFTGAGLRGKSVLDFGCGYGRMLRLLPWFTDRVYGCDPQTAALELCQRYNVWGQLARSDYLPADLPFGNEQFGVVIAFSVFTHTSARALRTALAAIRQRIRPDGLLVATIRPVEYWRYIASRCGPVDAESLEATHRERGFTFQPHNRPPVDGDITYGDASMTIDYLGCHEGWSVAGTDRVNDDPLQVPVFLRPK